MVSYYSYAYFYVIYSSIYIFYTKLYLNLYCPKVTPTALLYKNASDAHVPHYGMLISFCHCTPYIPL
jgi:hypothetical protein